MWDKCSSWHPWHHMIGLKPSQPFTPCQPITVDLWIAATVLIFAITGTGICLLRGHINNQSINQSINQSTNQSKNWLFDHSIDKEIDLVVYLTSETKYPNFCTKPMQRFFLLPTIAYNAKRVVLVLFFKACWRYQLTFFRQFRSQIRSHFPYIKCPLLRRKISPTEDYGYGLNGEAPTSEGYR